MVHTPNSFRFASVLPDGLHWELKRNCSVTPSQLLGAFMGLSGVSLAVAGCFWIMGATLVLPFALIELVALALAFVAYARHATDVERISLFEGRLVVEQENAGKTLRFEFARHVVQVGAVRGSDQLIEFQGGGRSIRVGRFLRSDLRPLLAREIRMALKGG